RSSGVFKVILARLLQMPYRKYLQNIQRYRMSLEPLQQIMGQNSANYRIRGKDFKLTFIFATLMLHGNVVQTNVIMVLCEDLSRKDSQSILTLTRSLKKSKTG